MGQSINKQLSVNISDVVEMKKSYQFEGNGLFAIRKLPKGTILSPCRNDLDSETNANINIHGGRMNDADFIKPLSFDYDQLYESFYIYETKLLPTSSFSILKKILFQKFSLYHPKEDNIQLKLKQSECNVLQTDSAYITTRDVAIGDELTKQYGIQKWAIFLANDLVLNKLVDDKIIKQLETLKLVLKELKYDFSYILPSN